MMFGKNRKQKQNDVRLMGQEDVEYRVARALAFLLPIVIVLSIFVIKGIFPFGDRSFLFSDMYHQYMPFFREFLHKIRLGEGLEFSWNLGIGSNFLALYVYYLASPLNWFSLLVPEAYLMEFMSYLVVLRLGLCGLTAFIYMKKHFQTRDGGILFFSCFYALSGYVAAYNWNIMWLDCLILTPLILLGLEKLVSEKKTGLYCVTLALSIFTNYYISIMICAFLVLYFIVLLVNVRETHTGKAFWRTLGRFAGYSVLAAMLAAILLIPEVCAILETDFGAMDFPEKLESYFSVLDMLTRHCMCVTTERGLEHWPNIYCGSMVFMLLPMYILNPKISIRERFTKMALAGFLLLSFGTNVLDFIWHGMNYPDSLPARQSFLYILLVLTACYEAYRTLEQTEAKQLLYGYLGAVVFLLCCEKFVISEDFDIGIEIATLVFVTIYAVIFYLRITRPEAKMRVVLGCVTLVAVVAESSINLYNTSIGTVSRSAYLDELPDYRTLYDWTQTQEEEFYRLEKFTRKTKNDATLAGYPSASLFSSTMNSRVMDFYERLGMRHSKVYYCFDGATAFTSALLNVKYMFGGSDAYENSLYTWQQQSGDIHLYRNNYSLPFGYVAPTGYDLPVGYDDCGLLLQNRMVGDLGIEEFLFLEEEVEEQEENVVFTAPYGGIYYGIVRASGTKKIDMIGGPDEELEFKDLKKGSVLYLGYLEQGNTITLTNGEEEDATQKILVDVYRMDEAVLTKALDILSGQHMENVTYDSNHFAGDITLNEPGRLILSIPKEDGWKITINGEETEAATFGGALMAFDLEVGEYAIAMEYEPEGSKLGVLLSALGMVIAGILLWNCKSSAKNSNKFFVKRN